MSIEEVYEIEKGYEKLAHSLDEEEEMLNEEGVFGDDAALRDACHASDIGEAYAGAQMAVVRAQTAYNEAVHALVELEDTLSEAPGLPLSYLLEYTEDTEDTILKTRKPLASPSFGLRLQFIGALRGMSERDANYTVNAAKAAVDCALREL